MKNRISTNIAKDVGTIHYYLAPSISNGESPFFLCCIPKIAALQVMQALSWTLDVSDLDDKNNKLVILSPDPDALSDTKDIDDSSTRKIEETMCDDECITHDTNVDYIL
ncbi:hypothetical protein AVEN_122306-1 [Araneus ventricosus]|uniref:Uncharacterized protein n=1 Tax=Araneus ventricosus TaxID=182803 RepID=A0A4Y2SKK7_ARAVE|nr:hypothetical protein AVEN_122306-1 [Araneus ventricosus]